MTNKDKALEFAKTYSNQAKHIDRETEVIALDTTITLIESAVKPDWFYPSKGEYPELMEDFVTDLGSTYYNDGFNLRICQKEDNLTDMTIHNIKAWTYLPKYIE